jgi:hypothetical protein
MKAIAIRSATPLAPADPHGLSLAQQNAVDLLAGGKNDTETAKALGLNRVIVTRWRLYSPEFRPGLAMKPLAAARSAGIRHEFGSGHRGWPGSGGGKVRLGDRVLRRHAGLVGPAGADAAGPPGRADVDETVRLLLEAAGRPVPPLANVPNRYLRPKGR